MREIFRRHRSGRIRSQENILIRPKFELNLLTLSDTYGNTAESGIRSTVANCLDDTGTLQSIAIDRHRVEGARNDGSTYYNTTAGGALLHPHKVVDGVSIAIAYEDWVAGTAFAAGSYCNNGGKYYSTVAGGTDSATFGDTITWVEQGLYNRRYGLKVSDAITNSAPALNFRKAAGTTNWGVGTFAVDDTGTGIDGGSCIKITDTDATAIAFMRPCYAITIPADTSTHTACILIKKNQLNAQIVQIAITGSGTNQSNIVYVDSVNGVLNHYINASIDDFGDFWVVQVWATNAGLNTELNLVVAPCPRPTLALPNDVTLTGSAEFDWPMLVLNTAGGVTDLVAGEISQATEMGNIKWDSTNLPTGGDLTYVMGWTPDFASGDLAASLRSILTFNDSIYQVIRHSDSGVTDISISDDGSAKITATMPAWDKNDTIYLAVTASVQTNTMALHYRNVSKGHAWTHVASVAYDGQFTDTGFLQLFKALGGNNSIVKFLLGYDRTLTDAELEARF